MARARKKRLTTSSLLLFVGLLVLLVVSVWWMQLMLLKLEPTALNQFPSYAGHHGIHRLKYTGSFGLGHRLSKLTAALHLAMTNLHIPLLEVDWGSCGGGDDIGAGGKGDDIFAHLFGANEILLSEAATFRPRQQNEKVIWIRNDVHGYYAGQVYKNFQIPLTQRVLTSWQSKLKSDATFLEDLFDRKLTCRDQIQRFQEKHHWKDHMVIGIHLRAGNGEQQHFTKAKRDMHMSYNTTVTIQTIHLLLKQLLIFLQHQRSKPPLIFLATDTASYIPLLRHSMALLSISVVVWEQPRVPDGHGVSYAAWQQQKHQCMQGWMASAADMALLASVDLLIAATRSTFSQIAPAAIVFHRNVDHQDLVYCEIDLPVHRMTCFRDQLSWLLRQPHQHGIVTFGINKFHGGMASMTNSVDKNDDNVSHKVMVHLPDAAIDIPENETILSAALEFLHSDKAPSNKTIFYYGRKYNRKYREKMPFRQHWVWANNSSILD